MSLHKEISFESDICDHLASHGWLYAEGDAAAYDRSPEAWGVRAQNHGAQAGEVLLARLREQIDQRGTLDVPRHAIDLLQERRTALISAAVTGHIDVRDAVAA